MFRKIGTKNYIFCKILQPLCTRGMWIFTRITVEHLETMKAKLTPQTTLFDTSALPREGGMVLFSIEIQSPPHKQQQDK